MATMQVAVFTTFAASRKEPLADMIGRVHAAFLAAGFGEPCVRFTLIDAPGSAEGSAIAALTGIKRVSSVERVLKRWPQFEKFARAATAAAGSGAVTRVISNLTDTGAVETVDFAILRDIAQGVPRSFPFHAITLLFSAPGFSGGPEFPAAPDRQTLGMLMRAGVDIGAGNPTLPGVSIKDSWWINGRQRYMAAMRVVEADPAAKRLPPPPAPIAAVFAACGKSRKTVQVPIASVAATPQPAGAARLDASETSEAIRSVVGGYRARIPELLEKLPHDLPHQVEHETPSPAMTTSGPKKPELVRAFAPMGYDCRGETGTFTLRRRTPGNLTVKLTLDVGTWSNSLMAFMQVQGLLKGRSFKATLNLPPSRQAARGVVHDVEVAGQFPIGGPDRWRQIVDNLAALVAELDRSFVPAVEAISGPSPEWFQPDTA
jgi:hypothetical protein